ncbi:hypothetical protein DUNSADRAFT_5813 [Dunaliella salina]|uniref:Sas10 C-terminal domain-containing protein n=1 Tax=Dunaliella salina TaxID=3046 RepID=A0ABQ7GPJ5_DUNSA|nr:hypothetical protein DUNSADRAFT_5813 [Dunaliella salina]|eukprot:KAF5836525.1 hypothetical protein DUNSADRAFT_5813 [Dunaliella salina]
MARGPKKQRESRQDVGSKKRFAKAAVEVQNADELSDGSDDEDVFQQKKDKVSLNVDEDNEDDKLEDEEGILNLDGSEEDESEEDDEGDDDEEDLDEEEWMERAIAKGGRTGALAAQAKALGQKLKLQQGEADSSGGEEEDEEEDAQHGKKKGTGVDAQEQEDRDWGANKRAYYADGDSEEPSDEEAAALEEAEVRRLQQQRAKRTTAADYGVEEDEEDEEGSSEGEDEDEEERKEGKKAEDTLEQAAKQAAAGDTSKKSSAKKAQPEQQQGQQAAGENGLQIRHKLGPLLDEVKSGRLATKEGLSYLEVKHLMMLHYCAHIVFYILLKAEGRPVRDHPVMQRLVEIRTCLEKIRPIDKQMAYQVDKLVRATQAAQQAEQGANGAVLQGEMDGVLAGPKHARSSGAGVEDEDDMLAFRPNPSQLLRKTGAPAAQQADAGRAGAEDKDEDEGGLGAGKVGVYRPPKLTPVSMDGDGKRSGGLSRDERRRLAEAGRKAARSEVVRALAAEVAGAPEEERHALPGLDSSNAIKMRQRLEMRAAEEEDMMTRVPLSREQVKALKSQRRAGMSTSGFADDFADDVADLVDAAGVTEASHPADACCCTFLLDDEIWSECAKRCPGAPHTDDDEDMYDLGGGSKRKSNQQPAEEDDFYKAAKEGAMSRKKARAEKYGAPATVPPLPDEEVPVGQPRKITEEIQKNRGLTPHRRKDLKNPRKKHRIKYSDAVIRRKGAVQEATPGAAGSYGGEATGIKARVTKGRKLG